MTKLAERCPGHGNKKVLQIYGNHLEKRQQYGRRSALIKEIVDQHF